MDLEDQKDPNQGSSNTTRGIANYFFSFGITSGDFLLCSGSRVSGSKVEKDLLFQEVDECDPFGSYQIERTTMIDESGFKMEAFYPVSDGNQDEEPIIVASPFPSIDSMESNEESVRKGQNLNQPFMKSNDIIVSAITTSSSYSLPSQEKSAKNPHPIDYLYDPKMFFCYPSDNSSSSIQHLGIFCFPTKCKLVHSLSYDGSSRRPASQCHTFVLTNDSGSKQFGTCLTVYYPLSPRLKKFYNSHFDGWKSAKYSQSDIEYVDHILEKLRDITMEATKLEEQNLPHEDLDDKINLYKSLLAPFSHLTMKSDTLYMPICFGVLGDYPFYSFYHDWLVYILEKFKNSSSTIPLEKYLVHLFHEIPVPPSGQFELHIPMDKGLSFPLSLPAVNQVSNSMSLPSFYLFWALSIENIICVFEHMIYESKIIFVSAQLNLLNIAAETITSFMYPLSWPHAYIPVLPIQLVDFIQAPFPYIMGCHPTILRGNTPEDALIVDLDRDIIKLNGNHLHKRGSSVGNMPTSPGGNGGLAVHNDFHGSLNRRLPSRDRKKLESRLKKYCNIDRSQLKKQHYTSSLTEDATLRYWNTVDTKKDSWKTLKTRMESELRKFVNCAKEPPLENHVKNKSLVSGSISWMLSPFKSNIAKSKSIEIAGDKSLPNVPEHISIPPPEIPPKATSQTITIPFDDSSEVSVPCSVDSRSTIHSHSNTSISQRISSENTSLPPPSPYKTSKRYSSDSIGRISSLEPYFYSFKSPDEAISHSIGNSTSSASISGTSHAYSQSLSQQFQEPEESRWIHTNLVNIPPRVCPYSLSLTPDIMLQRATCPLITSELASDLGVKRNFVGDTRTTLMGISYLGHYFHSVFIMEGSEHFIADLPNSVPLGLCKVCMHEIYTPILKVKETISTKTGYASIVSHEKTHNRTASLTTKLKSVLPDSYDHDMPRILQCSSCRMLTHPECMKKIGNMYCRGSFDPIGIQSTFLRLWASILSTYKDYLKEPPDVSKMEKVDKEIETGFEGGEGDKSIYATTNEDDMAKFKLKLDNAVQRLRGYTSHIPDEVMCRAQPDASLFDSQKFLNSTPLDQRQFLASLITSQSFMQFIQDRSFSLKVDLSIGKESSKVGKKLNYEAIFFDEIIRWRLNKSMLTSVPKKIPFLNEDKFWISSTVQCLTVDGPTIEEDNRYGITIPFSKDLLQMTPRSHRRFDSEAELHKLYMHTISILKHAFESNNQSNRNDRLNSFKAQNISNNVLNRQNVVDSSNSAIIQRSAVMDATETSLERSASTESTELKRYIIGNGNSSLKNSHRKPTPALHKSSISSLSASQHSLFIDALTEYREQP
jgi:hypothetical protein